MDGFKGKRTSGPIMPRKASGLVLHENMKKKDDNSVPICSRIGCSSRISSTKGGPVDHKAKSTGSLRSPSNGKETLASSSRSMSGFGGTKRSSKVTGRRQLSSLLDTDSSESSSVQDEAVTERALPRGKTKESTVTVHSENSVSGEVVAEVGSSSRGAGRGIHQRPDLVTRAARTGNSVQIARASVNRLGLRDVRSKSGSDVLPSSSNPTRKSNIFRKKNSEGESSASSSGNNNTDRSVVEVNNQSSLHGNGIPMSGSRRNINLPSVRDNSVISSITRRSTAYYGRTGRSGPVTTSQRPLQRATRADLNSSRSAEVSHSASNSHSRPISSSGRLRSLMMPGSPSEAGLSRLMNRDGFRRYNMNGVAEVLLALERIEQHEDLTYEQLVVLETNLFLNGVSSFHDQHRDMRLDIDDMSYEELLALEEKMGTVSTALSEEALLKSLKSSIYHPTDQSKSGVICLNKDDDLKCSICQEEYADGDEVGTLPCQHMYHVSCAQQWLRMKNWCPICKTSAESQPQPFP